MDERFLEVASDLEDKAREHATREASSKAISSEDLRPNEYLSESCERCDDDLPEFRKKKGLLLCVVCQTRKERGLR
jgi:hypothetical protein